MLHFDGVAISRRCCACFLFGATPATWLMLGLTASWSAASHLACAAPREGLRNEGSVSGHPSIVEEELGEMLPFEPFWDLLLPFLGLSVGAFGLRFSLGLSFLEPLLLFAMPLTKGIFRGFHDRLLAWHLGGIFGLPMLVAQLAVVRSESYCPGTGAAALGGLVGAYAVGAVVGAAIRRAASVWDPFLGLRGMLVLLLVANNMIVLYLSGDLFDNSRASHPSRSTISDPEVSPLLPSVSEGSLQPGAHCSRICEKIMDGIQFVTEEILRVLRILVLSSDTILARALILFSFTAVVSPTPARPVDLFAGTPLHHGFGVLWFDAAQVLTSAFVVPMALGGPFRFGSEQCLKLCFGVALLSCIAASLAAFITLNNAFPLVMIAGLSLGICVAFANAVLSLRTVRRTAKQESRAADAAVALGWGLLASGVSQVLGAEAGEYLYRHASWLGVTVAAGIACAAAWYVAAFFPDGDVTKKQAEPFSIRASVLRL